MTIFDDLRTLVLNADYTPLQVTTWRPAIEDVLANKAYVVEEHAVDVHSEKLTMAVPSVIVRNRRIDMYSTASFTRKNVLLAYWHGDTSKSGHNWTCGLCGGPLAMSDLTFDHIVPRFKGGKTSWENIVLAHTKCNGKKGCKTLSEAGMTLHTHIKRPTEAELGLQKIVSRLHGVDVVPDEWMDYIGEAYWNSTLQME